MSAPMLRSPSPSESQPATSTRDGSPTKPAARRGRAIEIIKGHLDQAQPWDVYITLPTSAVRALVDDECAGYEGNWPYEPCRNCGVPGMDARHVTVRDAGCADDPVDFGTKEREIQ